MRLPKLVWILLLVVFSLAACDVLGQLVATPVPATSTPEIQPTPVAGSTQFPVQPTGTELPEQPSGSIILRVWLPPEFDPDGGTLAGSLLRKQLDDFITQNPGVNIEVRLKAVEGPGGLLESLVATSAAAPLALPDLVALPRPLLESAALKGLIYPYDSAALSLDSADWYEYALQLGHLQTTLFGLPFAGDALVLVYRPTVASAPADWQALLSSNSVLVFPAADPNAFFTLTLYLAQGGQLQDEQGRPVLTESALLSVLEYYQQASMVNLMPFWLTQSETDSQAWATFTAEQHSMLVAWLSDFLSGQRGAAENLSLAPLPVGADDSFTLATGWTWALAHPDPYHRQLSARLAESLVAETFLAEWTQTAGFLPPRPAALAGWNDSTLRALLEPVARSAQLVPPVELLASLSPLLEEATVAVLKAENTPQAAVQAALEQLNAP